MSLIDQAQTKVKEGLNANGRSLGHVATGIGICVALIGVTAGLAALRPQPPAPGAAPSHHLAVRAIWPSLFSVTTLAALRIWNAPTSRDRTRALSLWSVLQTSNLVMTVWRPTHRNGKVFAAITTAALTACYARAAAKVDQKAANMSAPTGFAGLAAIAANPSL